MTQPSNGPGSGDPGIPQRNSSQDNHRDNYRGPERRRASWSSFREAYPKFLKVTAGIFLLLVIANMWLAYRRNAYGAEIERLRNGMTESEREKSDLIIESEKDKLRMAVELARRQARWDPQLHLSIAVDSGRMYLERDGALLRDMRVTIAPAQVPVAGDTTVGTIPRGERTIQEILRDSVQQIVLTGGIRLVASKDSTQLTPGSVRVEPSDMKAILGNLTAGMVVYFY